MTTHTFIRAALLASAAFALCGTAGADVFMKVAGAPGDATVRGFEEQIALTGASLNIMNTLDFGVDGNAPPERVAQVGPITFNKTPDRATPKLMLAAIQGGDLGTVEVTFTTPNRAGVQQIDARWILEGAKVNSYYTYPGANPGDAPVETVEVTYTSMRYQTYLKDAKGARTGAMEEVRWDAPETPNYGVEGCG
jgi:type VI protein secretion system component Hcp